MSRVMFAVLLGLLLAGCASEAPLLIRQAPPQPVSVAAVRQDPGRYQGRIVRWGGTIAGVENRHSETWVEIVDRPLWGDGRPREGDASDGRFVARVHGFLDPAIYEKGRAMTFYGKVDGEQVRPVGEYPYHYPVVDTLSYHLWAPLPPPPRWPDGYWGPCSLGDPFFPYYPCCPFGCR